MAKKKKLKLKKSGLIVIILCVTLVAFLGILLFMKEKSRYFVYKNNLDETSFLVDGQTVTLDDTSYYIWRVEKQINEMAITYNKDNPKEFWNTYFKAQLDSTFTRDYAKGIAKEISVYDYVMLNEAQIHNTTLTSSESDKSHEKAEDCYDTMSAYAKDNAAITIEKLYKVFENEAIINKYVIAAANDIKSQGYEGNVAEQLSYSGNYYKEKILTKYSVEYNEKIWGNITMGTITIE